MKINDSKEITHTHPRQSQGEKATGHLTEDLSHYFIVDDNTDETVVKISFFNDAMSPENKIKIGKEATREYLKGKIRKKQQEQEESFKKGQKDYQFQARASAFKDAYRSEEKDDKNAIVWLLIEIMGMKKEEAERRFNIVNEVLGIHEFEEKENDLVDKIYLNPDFEINENSKHQYVEYFK